METTITKTCPKCGRELPLDAFRKHNMSKDGRRAVCKECEDAAKERTAKSIPMDTTKGNPELSKFKPRELIAELIARGYRGKLTYTYEITL